MLRLLIAALALFILSQEARAQEPRFEERPGDVYDLRLALLAENTSDDSSGSSQSRTGMVERVIAVRDGGLELEFDLPAGTSQEDRARQWELPARVLKPARGPLVLLNATELETRLGAWLTAGQMDREMCGHWVFTWTAYKIECDPQSILLTLEAFDLRADLAPNATATELIPVDAEAMRRQRAEAQVVVAEITGEPITLEAALAARADEQISGEIATTNQADATGRVVRRTTITTMEIGTADGAVERQTSTQTVDRRLRPRPGA